MEPFLASSVELDRFSARIEFPRSRSKLTRSLLLLALFGTLVLASPG